VQKATDDERIRFSNPNFFHYEHNYTSSRRLYVEQAFQRDLEVWGATRSTSKTIAWLMMKGLLPIVKSCGTCGSRMRLVSARENHRDGYNYQCKRTLSCSKVSLRKGTFFDSTKLTLMESVRLIFHYYVRGFNGGQTVRELNEMIP